MRQGIQIFIKLATIFMLQAFTAFNLGRKGLRLVSSMKIQSPKTLLPYQAPRFARHFKNAPKHRLKLANLPTPLQDVALSNSVASLDDSVLKPLRDLNVRFLIKRDDMTAGVELGGNKVRKLLNEFSCWVHIFVLFRREVSNRNNFVMENGNNSHATRFAN